MTKRTNPMLLIDFYKAVHAEMLPKGITKSVSYFTPRMSRIKRWDKVVMFGLQGFIKTYLIDYFNEEFFNRPFIKVIREYKRIMDATLGEDVYNIEKVEKLHKLGYLPIEIIALPEGTLVPMHVPMFGITNTHPDFAWLPQSLESLISAEMWHPMLAATVGYTYREIVNKYYDLTCDDNIPRAKALGAFDFRGEECLQSAEKAGAGWCLSFLNTATVPTIPYLEANYHCDCTKEPVAFGSPSTEHSVMCSNYAVDGDEETLLRRLLTKIYPNTSFSAVLDSYDYWNVIENILPKLKKEIFEHNGCMLMRGDSGDPVDVICGTLRPDDYLVIDGLTEDGIEDYFKNKAKDTYPWNGTNMSWYKVRIGDYLYEVNCYHEFEENYDEGYYTNNIEEVEIANVTFITPEMKGTAEYLWEIFGGHINNKGFKVLNPHVKAIYGDSITIQRLEEIYQLLMKKGLACSNVALGVGSFSFQCIEEDGILKPFTRDTFSSCIKATYCEIDGEPYPIFKNPKDGGFKKSQKGCCFVYKNPNDELVYFDEYTWEEAQGEINFLKTVFKDGKFIRQQSLAEIRNLLHGGTF